ncbi:MAG TPA: TolC family protein [Tepidisphaeraceae bacterium]|nr:TolC family protein [Tepidisphaeraceae bacterium]
MMIHGKVAIALIVATLAGGCATVPKEAGFGEVRDVAARHTGHVVQWRGHSAQDTAVDSSVAALLSRELTVDQTVQIALLNNRKLQATFEDLGIAQADLVQAGLLKNPVFFGTWRFPDKVPNGTNAEYSVTQDFLDLLILPLRKRVASAQFESAKLAVANEVVQLAADVKAAYFTFQAREQLLTRLRLIVELNQTAAELARRQFEAGTLNDLNRTSQQAIYDQSKVDVAQAEAQLAADRERLNRLMGLWANQTTWKIADHLPAIPANEIPVAHLESLAIRRRLDLAATRAQLITLAQALAITKGYRYFTSIDLGVDTEREPGGQSVTGPQLSLQIPIFDQGQAQVAKLEAQFRQFQGRFQAMAIDARSEVREARDRMLAQRNLAEFYKVLLPERIRILNLTLQQYNGMLKGPYDLLLAKQSEVVAEQAYIDSWRDYWIARAQLERAVGGRLPEGPTSGLVPRPRSDSPENVGMDASREIRMPEYPKSE